MTEKIKGYMNSTTNKDEKGSKKKKPLNTQEELQEPIFPPQCCNTKNNDNPCFWKESDCMSTLKGSIY